MPEQLISTFASITGLPAQTSLILLWMLCVYFVLLIIGIPLHQALIRWARRKKEQLTRECDTLRYLLAKAQQKSSKVIENKGIQILFDLPKPDYVHHLAEIKQEMKSMESALGAPIVDNATRVRIHKLSKAWHNLRICSNIFGYSISLLTLFVYRLFW